MRILFVDSLSSFGGACEDVLRKLTDFSGEFVSVHTLRDAKRKLEEQHVDLVVAAFRDYCDEKEDGESPPRHSGIQLYEWIALRNSDLGEGQRTAFCYATVRSSANVESYFKNEGEYELPPPLVYGKMEICQIFLDYQQGRRACPVLYKRPSSATKPNETAPAPR